MSDLNKEGFSEGAYLIVETGFAKVRSGQTELLFQLCGLLLVPDPPPLLNQLVQVSRHSDPTQAMLLGQGPGALGALCERAQLGERQSPEGAWMDRVVTIRGLPSGQRRCWCLLGPHPFSDQ